MSKSELVPQAPVRVRGNGGDCRSVPAMTMNLGRKMREILSKGGP